MKEQKQNGCRAKNARRLRNLGIQRPPTTKLHHKNAGRNTKPSDSRLASLTAEGLDRRFFRSQPRVIGPGSLRKARPRRSEYQHITQQRPLNIDGLNQTLIGHPESR